MRPLTMINGVVLGSSLSIAVSLVAVLFVYILLGDEYPRLQDEFRPLLASTLIFFSLTAISGVSFYTLLTNHKTVVICQIAMWGGVAATTWYYWP